MKMKLKMKMEIKLKYGNKDGNEDGNKNKNIVQNAKNLFSLRITIYKKLTFGEENLKFEESVREGIKIKDLMKLKQKKKT